MAKFINTVDVIGDDLLTAQIIDRTVTEYKDDAVTGIGNRAFYNCTALETVDAPNATRIGWGAFMGCKALPSINIPKAAYIDGNAFRDTAITEADFPEVVTGNYNLFYACKKLIRANFPKLLEVGSYVFSDCSALIEVNLQNATTINSATFQKCSALRIIDLPKVTKINQSNTFSSSGLKHLILRSETICALTSDSNMGTGYYIYVPSALIEGYKVATNWSNHTAQFRVLEDYTVDGTITGALDLEKVHGLPKITSTIITPLNGAAEGELPLYKFLVTAGQVITLEYLVTKQQGYIYDGRGCGMNYYGSISWSENPMPSAEVGVVTTKTITAKYDGIIAFSGSEDENTANGSLSVTGANRLYGKYLKITV